MPIFYRRLVSRFYSKIIFFLAFLLAGLVSHLASAQNVKDSVFYVGGAGRDDFDCIVKLYDGTYLVGGATDKWSSFSTSIGSPISNILPLPTDPNTGNPIVSNSTKQAFILHLASNLNTVIRAVLLPTGTVDNVGNIKFTKNHKPGLTSPPFSLSLSQANGEIYISGTRSGSSINSDPDLDGYYIAKLNNNFIGGAFPTSISWIVGLNCPSGKGQAYKENQPWDVDNRGKVWAAYGEANGSGAASIWRFNETSGQREVVPNFRAHNDPTGVARYGSPASTFSLGPNSYSYLPLRAGQRGSLRSHTQSDYNYTTTDENGNPGRRHRYPDDAFFNGPNSPLETDISPDPLPDPNNGNIKRSFGDPGASKKNPYTGWRVATPSYRLTSLVVDKDSNNFFIGYCVQTKNAGGYPDFEPAIVKLDQNGGLKWWRRLFREVYPASIPDQYVDGLAVDYYNRQLVVVGRQHGADFEIMWRGNSIVGSTGGTWQNNIAGLEPGNTHVSWIGKYTLGTGVIKAATYLADMHNKDLAGVLGPVMADPNLDGWYDPNYFSPAKRVGSARLIHAGAVKVGDNGDVLVMAGMKRSVTTAGAYQKMPKPDKSLPLDSSAWGDPTNVRIYRSDLKTVKYSTLLCGKIDYTTGFGGSNFILKGAVIRDNSLIIVGTRGIEAWAPYDPKGNDIKYTNVANGYAGNQVKPWGITPVTATTGDAIFARLEVDLTVPLYTNISGVYCAQSPYNTLKIPFFTTKGLLYSGVFEAYLYNQLGDSLQIGSKSITSLAQNDPTRPLDTISATIPQPGPIGSFYAGTTLPTGNYYVKLKFTGSPSSPKSLRSYIKVVQNTPATVLTPSTQSASVCTNINQTSTFYTTQSDPNAVTYEWEFLPKFAISGNYNSYIASDSSITISWDTAFNGGTVQYRVRAINPCGIGAWSALGTMQTSRCISTTINDDYCAGSSFYIKFATPAKTYYKDTCSGGSITNQFIAQLSDNTGSFASPVQVGTRNLGPPFPIGPNIKDSILVTLPSATAAGTGYKLRINSTCGASNGSPVSIVVLNKPVKPSSRPSNDRSGYYTFTSSNDYLQANTGTPYNGVGAGADRTVEAWVKTNVSSPNDQVIVSWGANTSGMYFSFALDQSGKLKVNVVNGFVIGTRVINDGIWHHVAVSFANDGTPNINEAKLYVDGTMETISNLASQPINTSVANNVRIGINAYALSNQFEGSLDEVRIWDVAISPANLLAWKDSSNVLTGHPNAAALKTRWSFATYSSKLTGGVAGKDLGTPGTAPIWNLGQISKNVDYVCLGNNQTASRSYYLPPSYDATSYEWKLIPDTAGTVGGTGAAITISLKENAGTVKLIGRAKNGCGLSNYSDTLYIKLQNCLPATPSRTNICAGENSWNVGYTSPAISPLFSSAGTNHNLYLQISDETGSFTSGANRILAAQTGLPAGPSLSGTLSSINIPSDLPSGTYSIRLLATTNSSPPAVGTVITPSTTLNNVIYGLPKTVTVLGKPGAIVSSGALDSCAFTNYSISPVPSATNYTWSASGNTVGFSSSGTTSQIINWNTSPAPNATVSVVASNTGCSTAASNIDVSFCAGKGPLPPVTATSINSYRTINNGAWNVVGNWEKCAAGGCNVSGAAGWAAATASPTSADGEIFVRNNINVTANVTVDQVRVLAGATLTQTTGILTFTNTALEKSFIYGTLATNAGNIAGGTTARLQFENGSTYIHNINGGNFITPVWNTGSTAIITGVTNTVPLSASLSGQSFYNLTWNNAGQSGILALGLQTFSFQNGGTLKVLNTNALSLNLFNAAATKSVSNLFIDGSTTTVNITNTGNVNFNVDASTTISGNANVILSSGTTATTNFTNSGTVAVSNATISAFDNPANPTRLNYWYVLGNYTESGSTIRNDNLPYFRMIFSGSGTQNVSATGTYSSSTSKMAVFLQQQSTGNLNLASNFKIPEMEWINGSINLNANTLTVARGLTINGTGSTGSLTGLGNGHLYTQTLNMAGGIINNVQDRLTVLDGTSSGVVYDFNRNSYFIGGLRRKFNAGLTFGSGTYAFPVGTALALTPILLYEPRTATDTLVLSASVSSATLTSGDARLSALAGQYWNLKRVIGVGKFLDSCDFSVAIYASVVANNSAMGYSNTASGAYKSLGGLVTGDYLFNVRTFPSADLYTASGSFMGLGTKSGSAITGNSNVGNAFFYKNLSDVAADYNDFGLGGNVVFTMKDSYDGSCENLPIIFKDKDNNFTAKFQKDPSSGTPIITKGEPLNAPIIWLNGADNVTFDGNGLGPIKLWTIRNSNAGDSSSVIRIDNGSQNISLTNLIIEGTPIGVPVTNVVVAGSGPFNVDITTKWPHKFKVGQYVNIVGISGFEEVSGNGKALNDDNQFITAVINPLKFSINISDIKTGGVYSGGGFIIAGKSNGLISILDGGTTEANANIAIIGNKISNNPAAAKNLSISSISNITGAPDNPKTNVSNAVCNAGIITITTSAPHGLITGQTLNNVKGICGVASANVGSTKVISTPTSTTFTYTPGNYTISSYAAAGIGVTEVTITGTHNVSPGDIIYITGSSDPIYNGSWTVISSGITASRVRIPVAFSTNSGTKGSFTYCSGSSSGFDKVSMVPLTVIDSVGEIDAVGAGNDTLRVHTTSAHGLAVNDFVKIDNVEGPVLKLYPSGSAPIGAYVYQVKRVINANSFGAMPLKFADILTTSPFNFATVRRANPTIYDLRKFGSITQVITNGPHGLVSGDVINISGANTWPLSYYDGTYTILSVQTPTRFTINKPWIDDYLSGVPVNSTGTTSGCPSGCFVPAYSPAGGAGNVIYVTTNANKPVQLTKIDNGKTRTFTTLTQHGFLSNTRITISNAFGKEGTNGTWTIYSIDGPSSFNVYNGSYFPTPDGKYTGTPYLAKWDTTYDRYDTTKDITNLTGLNPSTGFSQNTIQFTTSTDHNVPDGRPFFISGYQPQGVPFGADAINGYWTAYTSREAGPDKTTRHQSPDPIYSPKDGELIGGNSYANYCSGYFSASRVVTTSSPHGLANGENISITGVSGVSDINGTWNVRVLDPTHFELTGSVPSEPEYDHIPLASIKNITKNIGPVGITNSIDYNGLFYNVTSGIISDGDSIEISNLSDIPCLNGKWKVTARGDHSVFQINGATFCNVVPDVSFAKGVIDFPYHTGIFSYGSKGPATNAVTISDNEIFNFSVNGINVESSGNGNGWIVKNNSFYNTGTTAPLQDQFAIKFNPGGSSENNAIVANYIGGSKKLAQGLPYGWTSGVRFTGIQVSAGKSGFFKIQQNQIRNIALLGGAFTGIDITDGKVLVGDNPKFGNFGNLIGGSTGQDSVLFDYAKVGYAIKSSSANEVRIWGNRISALSIDESNVFGSGVNGYADFIFHNGSGKPSIKWNTLRNISITNSGGSTLPISMIRTQSSNQNQEISYNDISNMRGYMTGLQSLEFNGIWVDTTNFSAGKIYNNRIYKLLASPAYVYRSQNGVTIGIKLSAVSDATNSWQIVNNQVSITDLSSQQGTGLCPDVFRGSFAVLVDGKYFGGKEHEFYYNTLYVGGRATWIYGSVRTVFAKAGDAKITLRNNIMYNEFVNTVGYSSRLLIIANTNNWSAASSDNNIYFSNNEYFYYGLPTGTTNPCVGKPYTFQGATPLSLEQFSSAGYSNTDKKSLNTDVNWLYDPKEGNLNLSPNNCPIRDKGVPVAGIFDDFDSVDVRDPVTPDIGSDEFSIDAKGAYWIGGIDQNWHVPNNWCDNRVPELYDDVYITNSPQKANMPVISTIDATCRDLEISNSQGTMLRIINPDGRLTLLGTLMTKPNNFMMAGGTIDFARSDTSQQVPENKEADNDALVNGEIEKYQFSLSKNDIEKTSSLGGVYTITTKLPHGYTVGMSIYIVGVGGSDLGVNGLRTVNSIIGVPPSRVFTIIVPSGPATGSSLGTGYATAYFDQIPLKSEQVTSVGIKTYKTLIPHGLLPGQVIWRQAGTSAIKVRSVPSDSTFTVTNPSNAGPGVELFTSNYIRPITQGYWNVDISGGRPKYVQGVAQVFGRLNLDSGIVYTNLDDPISFINPNLLVLGSRDSINATVVGGSNYSYIDGPLGAFPLKNNLTPVMYPIGKGGRYRPLIFEGITSPAYRIDYYLIAEQIEGNVNTLPFPIDDKATYMTGSVNYKRFPTDIITSIANKRYYNLYPYKQSYYWKDEFDREDAVVGGSYSTVKAITLSYTGADGITACDTSLLRVVKDSVEAGTTATWWRNSGKSSLTLADASTGLYQLRSKGFGASAIRSLGRFGISSSTQDPCFVNSSYAYWLGGTDSSWFNPKNWCGGILPTYTDSVLITNNPKKPYMPVVTQNGAECAALIVDPSLSRQGAYLAISANGSLKVTGKRVLFSDTTLLVSQGGVIEFANDSVLVLPQITLVLPQIRRGKGDSWSFVPIQHLQIASTASDGATKDIITTVAPHGFSTIGDTILITGVTTTTQCKVLDERVVTDILSPTQFKVFISQTTLGSTTGKGTVSILRKNIGITSITSTGAGTYTITTENRHGLVKGQVISFPTNLNNAVPDLANSERLVESVLSSTTFRVKYGSGTISLTTLLPASHFLRMKSSGMSNVIFSGNGTKTLTGYFDVYDTVKFNGGIVQSTLNSVQDTNILVLRKYYYPTATAVRKAVAINENNASHVDGPVAAIMGNQDTTEVRFPIGSGLKSRPLSFSLNTKTNGGFNSSNDYFIVAEQINGGASTLGNAVDSRARYGLSSQRFPQDSVDFRSNIRHFTVKMNGHETNGGNDLTGYHPLISNYAGVDWFRTKLSYGNDDLFGPKSKNLFRVLKDSIVNTPAPNYMWWRNEGNSSVDSVGTLWPDNDLIGTVSSYKFSNLSRFALGTIFPIELNVKSMFLQTYLRDNGVIVNWRSFNEKKVAYYKIERSYDAKNFTFVQTLPVKLNNGSNVSYDFLDAQANVGFKTIYYRVIATDLDGSIIYSNISELQTGTKQAFRVYPNPFSQQVKVELFANESGKAVVQWLDVIGKVSISQEILVQPGFQVIDLNVQTDLPVGTYLLRLTLDGETKYIRMIKE